MGRWTKAWRQCQALDSDGRQCRERSALRVEKYFGNPEHYGTFHEPWPGWVKILLCAKHRESPRAGRSGRTRGAPPPGESKEG